MSEAPLDADVVAALEANVRAYDEAGKSPSGNGAALSNPRTLRLKTVAELLADPNILAPPEPVAPRLAWRGYVSLLFGREKAAGKSTLLMAAAAAVTQGTSFLGESTLEGAVLWVSADQESASLLVGRATRFGALPERLHILWPGAAPFEELQQATSQVNPVWIVIDTLANFARVQQPKDAAEWPGVLLPLVRLARDEARALTLAHHARKAEEGGYRDSTAIGASVDVLLELKPVTDASPTQRRLTAIGRWTLDDASLDLAGEVYQLMASGQASLDARIISFVQTNPGCSHNAVTQALDARRESVWRAINTLVAGGLLIRRTSDTNVHQLWVPKAAPPL